MRRPNLLWITTDQHRWDALGVNGNADIRTPNLDALAGEGVNFDRFFVQNPVCMPSRMSYLTGQYPAQIGVLNNGPALATDAVTLPRMLGPYGYHSANIGKLHFQPHAYRDHRRAHPSYGFDQLEISDEPGCCEDAYRAWVRRVAPDQLDKVSFGLPPARRDYQQWLGIDDGIVHPDRNEKAPRAFAGRSDLTPTAFTAEQTLEYLQGADPRRPFLCVTGFFAPHAPWTVPQEYLDLYDPASLALPDYPEEVEAQRVDKGFTDERLAASRQGYYALISEVDHHVGRILDCLRSRGLEEETIVVFSADHGEWLGDHLKFAKGWPAHDAIQRVPCIVRYPAGGVAGGRTVHDIVEAVDVIPTLLHLSAIQPPPQLQGRPMPGIVEGAEPRDSALVESDGWAGLRSDRFRYNLRADGTEHLWDLSAPFGEYHDVAGQADYCDALSEHRKLLARRMIERFRSLERIAPY